MVRVLFVCLGNICRSPTADGIFRKLVADAGLAGAIESDSAGTSDYHEGSPPDARAMAAARKRGVDLSAMRARMLEPADLELFDIVLTMDRMVHRSVSSLRRAHRQGKADVRLFLEHAPHLGLSEVPDPYLGGRAGFEHVLDLVEEACKGLLAHIEETYLGRK